MTGITIQTDTGARELTEDEAHRVTLALRGWADDLDDELGPSPRTALGRRRRKMARTVRALAEDMENAALWATINAARA